MSIKNIIDTTRQYLKSSRKDMLIRFFAEGIANSISYLFPPIIVGILIEGINNYLKGDFVGSIYVYLILYSVVFLAFLFTRPILDRVFRNSPEIVDISWFFAVILIGGVVLFLDIVSAFAMFFTIFMMILIEKVIKNIQERIAEDRPDIYDEYKDTYNRSEFIRKNMGILYETYIFEKENRVYGEFYKKKNLIMSVEKSIIWISIAVIIVVIGIVSFSSNIRGTLGIGYSFSIIIYSILEYILIKNNLKI